MTNTTRKLTLSTKLNFGKYKSSDKTIYQIIYEDVAYVEWLFNIWEGVVDDKVYKMVKTFSERNK